MKYIWIVIVAAVVGFLGNSVYLEMNKEKGSAKSTRIACQKLSVTFERVSQATKIIDIQNAIKANAMHVNLEVEKAQYMESQMFNYVNPSSVKQTVLNTLKTYQKDDAKSSKEVVLDVLIYENDKGDPGKKTKKSKLYAGYLIFKFKVQKALVYQVQIDFMDLKGADITSKVNCAIESVMTLK
ncbi:MAG: hypothetical protein U9N30_03305 [Campylobacterota bacterium]|nr:hypothetical protein [Campylobacterota bacterium]